MKKTNTNKKVKLPKKFGTTTNTSIKDVIVGTLSWSTEPKTVLQHFADFIAEGNKESQYSVNQTDNVFVLERLKEKNLRRSNTPL